MGVPPSVLQVGNGATDASGNATITFDKEFTVAPKVFLQGLDAGAKGIVLDVVSISTTQVTVKARKVTGLSHVHSQNNVGSTGSASGTTSSHAGHYHDLYGGTMGVSMVKTKTAGSHTHTYSTVIAHVHTNPNTNSTGTDATVLAIDFNWLAVLI